VQRSFAAASIPEPHPCKVRKDGPPESLTTALEGEADVRFLSHAGARVRNDIDRGLPPLPMVFVPPHEPSLLLLVLACAQQTSSLLRRGISQLHHHQRPLSWRRPQMQIWASRQSRQLRWRGWLTLGSSHALVRVFGMTSIGGCLPCRWSLSHHTNRHFSC
jgi:hypothetical protein